MTRLLDVEDVDLRLGGRLVLDGVCVALEEGQFCGLIGSNGAGKTTLMEAVLGLRRPDRGRIRVDGSIGYVPQKLGLDRDIPLRSRDLVALGVDGHRFGFPRGRAARNERVDEALRQVGGRDLADAPVGRLSGGEQQRVMIAHALAGRPRLLVLDEPLANLDLRSVNEVVDVLAGVCRRTGVAVLISAHDVNPLLRHMDTVVYMAEGRAASGPAEKVVTPEVLSDLYRHPVEVLDMGGRLVVLAE